MSTGTDIVSLVRFTTEAGPVQTSTFQLVEDTLPTGFTQLVLKSTFVKIMRKEMHLHLVLTAFWSPKY